MFTVETDQLFTVILLLIAIILVMEFIKIITLLRMFSGSKSVPENRVVLRYQMCPYSGGYYDVVHKYWGWLPVTIKTEISRADAHKTRMAYSRLLRIKAIAKRRNKYA